MNGPPFSSAGDDDESVPSRIRSETFWNHFATITGIGSWEYRINFTEFIFHEKRRTTSNQLTHFGTLSHNGRSWLDSSDLEKEIVLVYSITQVRIKRTKEQPEDKRIIWTIT